MPKDKNSELAVRQAFSKNLVRLMRLHDINQLDLAKQLGVGAATVNDWVKCRTTPRSNVLKKLTELFGCTVTDLLEEEKPGAPAHKFEREVLAEGGMRLLLDADTKLTDEQLREIVNFIRYQQQKNDRT